MGFDLFVVVVFGRRNEYGFFVVSNFNAHTNATQTITKYLMFGFWPFVFWISVALEIRKNETETKKTKERKEKRKNVDLRMCVCVVCSARI